MTIDCDWETAEQVWIEAKNNVALAKFNVRDFFPDILESHLTLQQFRDVYIKLRQARSASPFNEISPRTVTTDIEAFQVLFEFADPNTPIERFDREAAEQFVMGMRSARTESGPRFKNTTINIKLRHLSAAFNYGERESIIKVNPFRHVHKLKTKRAQEVIKYLSRPEVEKIREYFAGKSSWLLEAFNFALWTGCRLETIFTANHNNVYSEPSGDGQERFYISVIEKRRQTRSIPLASYVVELIRERKALTEDPARLAVH